MDWQDIDWDDENARVADHFRVHEVLFLPSWRMYHTPNDDEKAEAAKAAEAMEEIRKFVNAPVTVHCWMRPTEVNAPDSRHDGENYNLFVGSRSRRSAHIFGRAVDFHVAGNTGPDGCHAIRQALLPQLEEWGIRMENNHGGWIHIDTNPVGHKRFFTP
ncbi:MAG: D-Ala-D-Ala carboxypeptidase family metallohydrolase [Gammaproteobacteria bacterium]|nr:D-Ala-D-Ala carboxypeptidase family metallohydrolase [Gammaproteobacteria bacterium]